MTTFADLVVEAQPYLMECDAAATEGATWRFSVTVVDSAGAGINLVGTTGTCRVIDPQTGSVLCSPSYTGGSGVITLSLDESATAGLVTGSGPRLCAWSLTVSDGTDVAQFWAASTSPFTIHPAA